MISYIRGTLTEVLGDTVVVEAGQVGVNSHGPLTVTEQLPRIGEEVLRLENLTQEPYYRGVNLTVQAGEVLGVVDERPESGPYVEVDGKFMVPYKERIVGSDVEFEIVCFNTAGSIFLTTAPFPSSTWLTRWG